MGGLAPGAMAGGMGGGMAPDMGGAMMLGGGGLAPAFPVVPPPTPIDFGGAATLATAPPAPIDAVPMAPAVPPATTPPSELASMLQRAQDMQRMLPGQLPQSAGVPSRDMPAFVRGRADPEAWAALQEVARKYGVAPEAMAAVIKTESNWNPRTSTGSYNGLTQIGNQSFKEAGGTLGGMTYDQYLKASPADQIRVYDAWLNHYKFGDQIKNLGLDLSKMPVERQAAVLQGFQFSPNGMGFKNALAQGRTDVPSTGTVQARALGDTSIGQMENYYRRILGPSAGSPTAVAQAPINSPPPLRQFPNVAQADFPPMAQGMAAGTPLRPGLADMGDPTRGAAYGPPPPPRPGVDRFDFAGNMPPQVAEGMPGGAGRFAQMPQPSIAQGPAVPPNGSTGNRWQPTPEDVARYGEHITQPIQPPQVAEGGMRGSDMAAFLERGMPQMAQGSGMPPLPSGITTADITGAMNRPAVPPGGTKSAGLLDRQMGAALQKIAPYSSSGQVDAVTGEKVGDTQTAGWKPNWKGASRMVALGMSTAAKPMPLPPMPDIPPEQKARRGSPGGDKRMRRFQSAFPINEA